MKSAKCWFEPFGERVGVEGFDDVVGNFQFQKRLHGGAIGVAGDDDPR